MTIRDMLFTPSSSDSAPLISTAPLSSSCGVDGMLIIQRPPCEEGSFAWSDFPIIENHSFFPAMSASYESSDSSTEDSCSTASQDSHMSLSCSTPEKRASTSSESSNKRVKFSPHLEVRTHSITLGDHPCCAILAVELGWDYSDTEQVDIELHEMKKAYHGKARRRSYLERKQLLQEFVGDENLQSSLPQQPNLKKGGSSSLQLSSMS